MNENGLELDTVEQVAAEFLDRCLEGEAPTIEDYATRYPQLAETIHGLFPMIAALEGVKREDRHAAARNATSKPLVLTELGDFEILREIGRGGMGIVYEANQKSLGRRVALKVLPKQALLDPVQLRRFQCEARIAARLHHTNIVSLFGNGEHNGFHFLVMQLIEGESLQQVISRLQLLNGPKSEDHSGESQGPPVAMAKTDASVSRLGFFSRRKRTYWNKVAQIGQDAARALQYASEQGVYHRDIKPGNLLLDHQGKIWITDFGLAQALSGQELSVTQSIAGTLNYIPPEGFAGQYNEQSDVYGLGLTLYELLTLKPAFTERSPAEVAKRIANESFQPKSPRTIDPSIPRDLEMIVMKAIAHDSKQRYRTAGDLAADLELFLEDRPVNARRTSLLERGWRCCKRNKAISAMSAFIVSLLLLVSIVMTISYLHARQATYDVQSALFRERNEREHSEATLQIAINVLDDIYNQFSSDDVNAYLIEGPSSLDWDSSHSQIAQLQLTNETAIFLEKFLRFYDRLAEEIGNNLQLLEASAIAQGRLGDIHRELGRSIQALDRYSKALQALERLRRKYPELSRLNREAARVQNEIGRVHFAEGNYLAARHSHEQALELLDESFDSDDIMRSLYERARAQYFLGRRPQVSASRVALEQLVRGDLPVFPDRDPPLGLPQLNPSESMQTQYLYAAVDALETSQRDDSKDPSFQFLLACCYRELPQTQGGKWLNAATVHGEKAIELLSDLVKRFPENQHYRYELVETLRSDVYGTPHMDGRREAMLNSLNEAIGHADYLVDHHPNVPLYAVARMHVLHKLGHALSHAARATSGTEQVNLLAESKNALQGAHDQVLQLTKRWPDVMSYKLWHVIVEGSLAQTCLDIGCEDDAKEALESALSTLKGLSKAKMISSPIQTQLSDVNVALSEIVRRADVASFNEKKEVRGVSPVEMGQSGLNNF